VKYYTWKIKWDLNDHGNLEGRDPSYQINLNPDTRIDPSFADNHDLEDPNTKIYCYLSKGTIDPSEWSDWFVEEVSKEEFLVAAQGPRSDAFFDDEGFVVFPEVQEEPV
jgi:hypothetical protein